MVDTMTERKKIGLLVIYEGIHLDLVDVTPVRFDCLYTRAGVHLQIQWVAGGAVESYKEKGQYNVYSDGTNVTVEKKTLEEEIQECLVRSANSIPNKDTKWL